MFVRHLLPLTLTTILSFVPASRGDEPRSDAARPAPEPTQLSGKGDRATRTFSLEPGLVIWKVEHEGRSNFQVHLLNEQGDEVDLPVNHIGRYTGSQAGHVRHAGKHRLQVKADGAWKVTLEQPRPAGASESPQSFTGQGPHATACFALNRGSHVVESKHRGEGIFRVVLVDQDGRPVEQAAGIIGHYDGSKAIKVSEPGVFLLNVVADGDWEISVD